MLRKASSSPLKAYSRPWNSSPLWISISTSRLPSITSAAASDSSSIGCYALADEVTESKEGNQGASEGSRLKICPCCRIIAMNIGMVSPYSWDFPGGVNRHVEQLSEQLRRRGHKVTVIAPDGRESEDFHNAGKSISIRSNRSVANLSFGAASAARMKRFLSGKELDLLHLHEPLIPSTSMLALHYSNCANLATFHAAREGGSRAYSLARPLLRPLVRKIDVRVAVSESAKQLISG